MWRSLLRARWPLLGLAILTGLLTIAVFAPALAPHEPAAVDVARRLKPPAWAVGSIPGYPLGTDSLGRDIISRLLFGARISLLVGVISVLLAGTLGVLAGLAAGYAGGWLDSVLMRLADIQMAFPFILLALTVMAVIGAGVVNIILVLGVSGWMAYARVVRGEVLQLREREFVEAARAVGSRGARIAVRHILPNVIAPVIVVASFAVASAILAEASLSFLGLGVPPSVPTWGSMLADGREFIREAPWLTVLPGAVIFVTVLSINLVGDWLRDFLDPRLKV